MLVIRLSRNFQRVTCAWKPYVFADSSRTGKHSSEWLLKCPINATLFWLAEFLRICCGGVVDQHAERFRPNDQGHALLLHKPTVQELHVCHPIDGARRDVFRLHQRQCSAHFGREHRVELRFCELSRGRCDRRASSYSENRWFSTCVTPHGFLRRFVSLPTGHLRLRSDPVPPHSLVEVNLRRKNRVGLEGHHDALPLPPRFWKPTIFPSFSSQSLRVTHDKLCQSVSRFTRWNTEFPSKHS
jgi:hypothetical protein